jgi:uncharacterized protein YqeY
MSLLEQLDNDLKAALLAHDEDRKRTVRSVKTAATNAMVEKRATEGLNASLSDEEVLKVIAKQANQRRDSIAEFSKAGRLELVAQEQAELAILESYLPKQLERDEVEAVVRQVIAETGASSAKDMGLVMRVSMARLQGLADGKLVNQLARELLG